ncbi:hypothetical protein ACROYT_G000594 [Oculina patagonica]
MAGNYSPFGGDSESPFSDPSVASFTSNPARGLQEFNPFDDDQGSSQARGDSKLKTTPTAQLPPPSQPAVLQTGKEPPSSVVAAGQENLERRQENLESTVAELQRREQELQRRQMGGLRANNFPPLPAKCPCKPCFFNDISIDIPINYQKTCRGLYIRWQVYSFTLVFNFLSALALLVDNDEPVHEGQTFGISIAYLIFNVPLSFLGWYRTAYNALKDDGSFCFVMFLIIYFLHILVNIFYCIGAPGYGACGFINGTEAFHQSVPVGAMMFACGGLFLGGAIVDMVLLVKIHRFYRLAGASVQKAQEEFATGVAFNPQVKSAAADAAAYGVQSAIRRE